MSQLNLLDGFQSSLNAIQQHLEKIKDGNAADRVLVELRDWGLRKGIEQADK